MNSRNFRIPRQEKNGQNVIVLAGEDSNDCRIMAYLVRQHHPGLADSKLVQINDKVRLKSASAKDLPVRISTLVGKAKGRALRARGRLQGLVIHEDLDGYTDENYLSVRKSVADELSRQSPCDSAFALAAWESEAWLLLFPSAFEHVHSTWKVPASLNGRDTGLMKSPKEEIRRKIGRPVFRESDGPDVAKAAHDIGLLGTPSGKNSSYADFVAELSSWKPISRTQRSR